jgi:hypothetical protein
MWKNHGGSVPVFQRVTIWSAASLLDCIGKRETEHIELSTSFWMSLLRDRVSFVALSSNLSHPSNNVHDRLGKQPCPRKQTSKGPREVLAFCFVFGGGPVNDLVSTPGTDDISGTAEGRN